MKHTKKRTLLSAIAMLIVSAVVLSSATYAWFTAGNQARVNGISASVGTSSSIQVSADNGSSWLSDLVPGQFEKADDYFPLQLTAVSTPAASPTLFYNGEFGQNSNILTTTLGAESPADLGSKLVKFTFLIKATSNVTVNYAGSTLTGDATSAVYSLMKIGAGIDNANAATPIIYKSAADTYVPINAPGTATDSTGNSIINVGDIPAPTILGAQKTATLFNTAATFDLDANVAKQIIVYMWLEGNDANCFVGTGGVANSANLALTFVATPR